jgi:hypothetical protein
MAPTTPRASRATTARRTIEQAVLTALVRSHQRGHDDPRQRRQRLRMIGFLKGLERLVDRLPL